MDEGTTRLIIPSINALLIIIGIAFIIFKTLQRDINRIRRKNKRAIKRDTNQQQGQYQPYTQSTLPYYLMNSVFTFHESILYEILDDFCRHHKLVLLSKVRIADFVQPIKQKNFYLWFNRISAKHVDFLICQPKSYKPLLAVELDDYTHQYKTRRERDDFVNQIYQSVGLPILHITELRQSIVERNLSELLGITINGGF